MTTNFSYFSCEESDIRDIAERNLNILFSSLKENEKTFILNEEKKLECKQRIQNIISHSRIENLHLFNLLFLSRRKTEPFDYVSYFYPDISFFVKNLLGFSYVYDETNFKSRGFLQNFLIDHFFSSLKGNKYALPSSEILLYQLKEIHRKVYPNKFSIFGKFFSPKEDWKCVKNLLIDRSNESIRMAYLYLKEVFSSNIKDVDYNCFDFFDIFNSRLILKEDALANLLGLSLKEGHFFVKRYKDPMMTLIPKESKIRVLINPQFDMEIWINDKIWDTFPLKFSETSMAISKLKEIQSLRTFPEEKEDSKDPVIPLVSEAQDLLQKLRFFWKKCSSLKMVNEAEEIKKIGLDLKQSGFITKDQKQTFEEIEKEICLRELSKDGEKGQTTLSDFERVKNTFSSSLQEGFQLAIAGEMNTFILETLKESLSRMGVKITSPFGDLLLQMMIPTIVTAFSEDERLLNLSSKSLTSLSKDHLSEMVDEILSSFSAPEVSIWMETLIDSEVFEEVEMEEQFS